MIFSNIEVEGRAKPAENRGTGGMTVFRTVTPEYFSAMGIPILHGRAFTEEDRASAEKFAILDETMARRLFPGEDPVGRRMQAGLGWRTIIGVARKAKNAGLTGADDPEYYYVWRKGPDGGRRRAHLIIRSEADPAGLASLVRSGIAELDPTLPLTITTMRQNLGQQIQRPRFESFLLSLFANPALAADRTIGVFVALADNKHQGIVPVPEAIDYVLLEGPNKGKTLLGIYELTGDTLKSCFAAPGKDRPTDFATKAGDLRTLSAWKWDKR